MTHQELSQALIQFIEDSPSMFHTVQRTASDLEAAGYKYLAEQEPWDLEAGGKYYTTRNGSSILAFQIGEDIQDYHYQITASHTDSPTFKVKDQAELEGPGPYTRLNVEAYGGPIDNTWFDRPLSVAGRVFVDEGSHLRSELVYVDEDLLIIPNVAIHMNRKINSGYDYNRQVDLLPLFSTSGLEEGAFLAFLEDHLGLEKGSIIGHDLYLVNRQKGSVWGYEGEFVSSKKLDNLQSVFTTLQGFLQGNNPQAINVFVAFDNEEVGSNTKQGALSTFLKDSLKRINSGLGYSDEDYYQAIAKSLMLSVDNAHGVHPNHPAKTDKENKAYLNQGIVIKEAANQKYTTDAFSRAAFKKLCQSVGVPTQSFANRSDTPGGSTLGNLSNTQVSLNALDIGLAQLAMHSTYETAGAKDTEYAVRAFTAFYQKNWVVEADGSLRWD